MSPLQKVRHHNKLQQVLCSAHTSLSLCCWAWACEWNMAATLQACLPRVLFVMTFWLAEVAWMGDNPGGLNSWLNVPQKVCWCCLYLHAAACNVPQKVCWRGLYLHAAACNVPQKVCWRGFYLHAAACNVPQKVCWHGFYLHAAACNVPQKVCWHGFYLHAAACNVPQKVCWHGFYLHAAACNVPQTVCWRGLYLHAAACNVPQSVGVGFTFTLQPAMCRRKSVGVVFSITLQPAMCRRKSAGVGFTFTLQPAMWCCLVLSPLQAFLAWALPSRCSLQCAAESLLAWALASRCSMQCDVVWCYSPLQAFLAWNIICDAILIGWSGSTGWRPRQPRTLDSAAESLLALSLASRCSLQCDVVWCYSPLQAFLAWNIICDAILIGWSGSTGWQPRQPRTLDSAAESLLALSLASRHSVQ